ncbi:MAG: hypothetical protein HON53_24845 [Planctomycetaceae bacterium]|jgi:hypothetical protein|nr:hypothetical protein [Planctomycetaceae bacterium]MBT6154788.1 hypothetical protein [Planctomycetaceae bacterium]MBT6486655.1 hypothetical protein [Planctomycetaceae bacterium]MBT6495952.1 hypothetical protein [Planctomycetaceae bacterium]
MKKVPYKSATRDNRRRGLAPLELVLALPMMLFVMALMVNIGTVGAWKVREQANVRNASWRTLHLRTGDSNPNPPMWPANAQVNGSSGSDMTQPGRIWDQDQDLTTTAVRGDIVNEPTQGMSIRVNRMLEIQRGVHDGRAPLERQIPMLRGVIPNNGRYNLNVRQNILDGNWEYHNIKFRGQGYGRNLDRRAKVLYDIEPSDFPSSAQLQTQARRSLAEIQNPANYTGNASWFDLAPLDADADLARLSLLPPRGESARPPNPDGGIYQPTGNPPDLYPGRRVIAACLADPSLLRTSRRYTDYIEEIQRLPGRTARVFRSYYSARKNYLEQQDPPIAGSDAEIQQLQSEIDLLDAFLGALPQQNR